MSQAIRIEKLRKSFGKTFALDEVDLDVPSGIVYGLISRKDDGKTTAVRILAMLPRADGGRAFVDGHDVVRVGDAVRRIIGLTGQYAALDEALTGRENLVLIARLHGLTARDAKRRADEMLERV